MEAWMKEVYKKIGVEVVSSEDLLREFARNNLLLPFMSFKERREFARRCRVEIEALTWYTRLWWFIRAKFRFVTRRGRAADRIIRKLLK